MTLQGRAPSTGEEAEPLVEPTGDTYSAVHKSAADFLGKAESVYWTRKRERAEHGTDAKSETPSAADVPHEATPTTDPSKFRPVRGMRGKVHVDTGEIWVKDTFHKNHYEVYKNKKMFENKKRSRSVWEDGRVKEKF